MASVYEVDPPAQIKQLLSAFRLVITLGISDLTTPLECAGLHGYQNQLRFWMIMPLILIAIVAAVALVVMRTKRMVSRTYFVQLALPWVLRLLFFLYVLLGSSSGLLPASHLCRSRLCS